ncbi:hypothetical protein ONS95_004558 [Cadophora gregata]|uniref:uncharacterized protein n=1 Tax=Cadophora gregata TaxID=51156 RepID=UPI0026DB3F9C|nr:uncharacterized protein ONS95_004558 [Cadophora gregata]KAK0106052.1 hypothetical protein ONS95_004558 [Cadophora gregata]
MKVAFILSGLAAFASCMAVEKRDGTCAQQPAGSGPPSNPDTPSNFQIDPNFTNLATAATTPTNYTLAFSNGNAATAGTTFVGSTLLTTYAPAQCASFCTQTMRCAGFNIYFERDPSLDPNAVGCPNPAGVTNIKCILWGETVSNTTATNYGQFRASFQVVVAGSNGYNRVN